MSSALLEGAWFCCQCHDGPILVLLSPLCHSCAHERCFNCIIDVFFLFNDENSHIGENAAISMLFKAVRKNDMRLVEELVQYGVDINRPDQEGFTPIHIATMHHGVEMVELLLSNGAYVNAAARDGRTALTMALERRSHSLVERLIKEKAKILEPLSYLFNKPSCEVKLFIPNWDMFQWLRTEVSGINDLHKMVTVTGFLNYAQMESCEDYVLQTWGVKGMELLSILGATSKIPRRFMFGDTTIEVINEHTLNIEGSTQQVIDTIEQISWLLCVFGNSKDSRGLSVTYPRFRFRSTEKVVKVSLEKYPIWEYFNLEEICWTRLLPGTSLAVGFPIRHREAGIGLEIPFPLLLSFAEISISMDFDGGVILVGPSAVIFP